MVFTLTQKIQIYAIRILIAVLWKIDTFVISLKNALYVFSYIFLAVLIFIVFPQSNLRLNIHNSANYIYEGLLQNNYLNDISNINTLNSQVLGTFSIRSKENQKSDINFPNITAKSVLVKDLNTKRSLLKYNSTLKFASASTTKLMTALVALDIYKPDEDIAILKQCTYVEGQKAGLPEKAIFKFKDLLYTLLIDSAGDVACIFANSKINQEQFVSRMNEKTKELDMKNTNFTNPIGLDGTNGTHYSTSEDLLKLAENAIKIPIIKDIVKTKYFTISSEDSSFSTYVNNTNQLLWDIPNTVGIKTGKTQEAGEVLIYEYKDDTKNIIIIVMGSENRFADTKEILKWIIKNYYNT